MSGLAGKPAFVSGAGSGVGRAIAQRAHVVAGIRDINNAGDADETTKLIIDAGVVARLVRCGTADHAPLFTGPDAGND